MRLQSRASGKIANQRTAWRNWVKSLSVWYMRKLLYWRDGATKHGCKSLSHKLPSSHEAIRRCTTPAGSFRNNRTHTNCHAQRKTHERVRRLSEERACADPEATPTRTALHAQLGTAPYAKSHQLPLLRRFANLKWSQARSSAIRTPPLLLVRTHTRAGMRVLKRLRARTLESKQGSTQKCARVHPHERTSRRTCVQIARIRPPRQPPLNALPCVVHATSSCSLLTNATSPRSSSSTRVPHRCAARRITRR
eukprot:737186-Pleurochrysis_carterae.AAC.1